MKKIVHILIPIFIMLLFSSCSGSSENGKSAGQAVISENGTSIKASAEQDAKNASGKNEYTSEKYGFAFKYNQLKLVDKINGDNFVELTHLSGDKAVVSIKEPDPLMGDPEEWLKNAYKESEYKVYQRKEYKAGKYPALKVEFGWTVMKKPIRTMEVIALKDGYVYRLIITMNEQYVDDTRREFDIVADSFRLLDNKVDLEALTPWKEQLPEDFPHDVVPLFSVDKVTSVFGGSIAEKGYVTVRYDSKEEIDKLLDYYKDLMSKAEDFEYNPVTASSQITGKMSGFKIEVKVVLYEKLDKCTVTVSIHSNK